MDWWWCDTWSADVMLLCDVTNSVCLTRPRSSGFYWEVQFRHWCFSDTESYECNMQGFTNGRWGCGSGVQVVGPREAWHGFWFSKNTMLYVSCWKHWPLVWEICCEVQDGPCLCTQSWWLWGIPAPRLKMTWAQRLTNMYNFFNMASGLLWVYCQQRYSRHSSVYSFSPQINLN